MFLLRWLVLGNAPILVFPEGEIFEDFYEGPCDSHKQSPSMFQRGNPTMSTPRLHSSVQPHYSTFPGFLTLKTGFYLTHRVLLPPRSSILNARSHFKWTGSIEHCYTWHLPTDPGKTNLRKQLTGKKDTILRSLIHLFCSSRLTVVRKIIDISSSSILFIHKVILPSVMRNFQKRKELLISDDSKDYVNQGSKNF